MKKTITIALMFLLLISFAACSFKSPSNKITEGKLARELLEAAVNDMVSAKGLSVSAKTASADESEPVFLFDASVNPQSKDATCIMKMQSGEKVYDVIDTIYISSDKCAYINVEKLMNFVSEDEGKTCLMNIISNVQKNLDESSDVAVDKDLISTYTETIKSLNLPGYIYISLDEKNDSSIVSPMKIEESIPCIKSVCDTLLNNGDVVTAKQNVVTITINDNTAEQIANAMTNYTMQNGNNFYTFLHSFVPMYKEDAVSSIYKELVKMINNGKEADEDKFATSLTIGDQLFAYTVAHENEIKSLTAETFMPMSEIIKVATANEIKSVLAEKTYVITIDCNNKYEVFVSCDNAPCFEMTMKTEETAPEISFPADTKDIVDVINSIYSPMNQ